MPRRTTAAYLVAIGTLLAGSVLCLIGSGMVWGTAQRAGLAGSEVVVTGGDLVPAGELRSEVAAVLQDEADRGLDPERRVVMRFRVNAA